MLTRRPPFVQEENDRTIRQDGFSAPVENTPRPRFSSACAMVGRHVMDFSDNGDGTHRPPGRRFGYPVRGGGVPRDGDCSARV